MRGARPPRDRPGLVRPYERNGGRGRGRRFLGQAWVRSNSVAGNGAWAGAAAMLRAGGPALERSSQGVRGAASLGVSSSSGRCGAAGAGFARGAERAAGISGREGAAPGRGGCIGLTPSLGAEEVQLGIAAPYGPWSDLSLVSRKRRGPRGKKKKNTGTFISACGAFSYKKVGESFSSLLS